jgi:hypothetical protein
MQTVGSVATSGFVPRRRVLRCRSGTALLPCRKDPQATAPRVQKVPRLMSAISIVAHVPSLCGSVLSSLKVSKRFSLSVK